MNGKSLRIVQEPVLLCDQCEHTFWPSATPPSPSFTEQCREFYTPAKRQRDAIICEMSRLEDIVDDYDRKLARLRDVVAQLEIGRAQVQTRIDDYASVASAPIRRIRNSPSRPNDAHTLSSAAHYDPDGILKRIFAFACLRDDDENDPKAHIQWLTPLTISHVCSHWREVSLDIPEMWSYLDINWLTNPTADLELLHMYITRTKSDTPLSIRIDMETSSSHFYSQALILLLDHARQWREAIITVDHQVLRSFLSSHFDILEKLVLRVQNIQTSNPVEYFKFVPRLRYVKIDAPLGDLLSPTYLQRVVNLKQQEGDADILSFQPHLLDVPDLHLSLFPKSPGMFVQWINIKALAIHSLTPDLETRLQTITMPNLHRLNIALHRDYTFDISFFQSLLSLVLVSRCKLRAFSLDMTHCHGTHRRTHKEKFKMDENAFWDFLNGVPSIRELRIVEPRVSGCGDCDIVSTVLRSLDLGYDPLVVSLPRLRRLEVVWTAEVDWERLVRMVMSRLEEHELSGGTVSADSGAGEERGSGSESGGDDDVSMSDASSSTSVSSDERDSDGIATISPLETVIIGARGEIEVDSDIQEWMGETRARGVVVHLL
ncbi:hypothetical protein IW261DRAFT_1588779 [Armillaria novae-zelandiae]|uniref:F-box domain-containing protein n=1 Tax=Armillaria novae-zelandiae TaxID=153914 RepID=A0AA39PYX8_9AGAR|nr:hypothetical protein IW261DRAFT_1588779 [Armillaria novae-zelandiae]